MKEQPMKEQSVVISLPMPAGYRMTGEFRPPNPHELYVSTTGGEVRRAFADRPLGHHLIVSPALSQWQVPEWLPVGAWVYSDSYGHDWFVSMGTPLAPGNGAMPFKTLATFYQSKCLPPPVPGSYMCDGAHWFVTKIPGER